INLPHKVGGVAEKRNAADYKIRGDVEHHPRNHNLRQTIFYRHQDYVRRDNCANRISRDRKEEANDRIQAESDVGAGDPDRLIHQQSYAFEMLVDWLRGDCFRCSTKVRRRCRINRICQSSGYFYGGSQRWGVSITSSIAQLIFPPQRTKVRFILPTTGLEENAPTNVVDASDRASEEAKATRIQNKTLASSREQ